MTAKDFWNKHAPDFNFELGEGELVELALERGVIHSDGLNSDGEPVYIYNEEWLNG